MSYNRIVRPVQNNSQVVTVKLGLKLSQLIDVNLKEQTMTTNIWLKQQWFDYKLKWDPSEYGGIEDLTVPAEQIWLPDIVLYNSAEGYFAVSIMTKAQIRYDGQVSWNPPAIFRSSCQIDVTYFPFDSQNCSLKFGSWTYGTLIDLRHVNETNDLIERGIDLSSYHQNVEWDIMQASARRNFITYTCCPNDFYPDVTFYLILRRKLLFYTINLILPCIMITGLSLMVFYLPSDCGEKVTLTISILVSLIFFLSVLIETIPTTSLVMPLLGKYLVFTMILITLSVCATVLVLNIHFRTPSTHTMPGWVKRWCIDILPRYLFLNTPHYLQAANVLPEQLIYPHNAAYANAGAWPSAAGKAPASGPPRSQSAGAAAAAAAAAGASQDTGHRSTTAAATPADRQLEQLSAAAALHRMHGWPVASPTSLFLPYLQSEAARRLQMQRSRSSDQRSLTLNESCQSTFDQQTSFCDREWARQQPAPPAAASSASDKRAKSKRAKRAPAAAAGSKVAPEEAGPCALSGAWAARGQAGGPLQAQSSSSVENDYNHHSHFRARASVCSTNLWRVGPARRCSVTAPLNYPTYYNPPLTEPAPVHCAGELCTLSGCLSRGQAHLSPSRRPAPGAGDPGALGALIAATARQMSALGRPGTAGAPRAPVGSASPETSPYGCWLQARRGHSAAAAAAAEPSGQQMFERQVLLAKQVSGARRYGCPVDDWTRGSAGPALLKLEPGALLGAAPDVAWSRNRAPADCAPRHAPGQEPRAGPPGCLPRSRSTGQRLGASAADDGPLYLPAHELPPPPAALLCARGAGRDEDPLGRPQSIGRALGQAYANQRLLSSDWRANLAAGTLPNSSQQSSGQQPRLSRCMQARRDWRLHEPSPDPWGNPRQQQPAPPPPPPLPPQPQASPAQPVARSRSQCSLIGKIGKSGSPANQRQPRACQCCLQNLDQLPGARLPVTHQRAQQASGQLCRQTTSLEQVKLMNEVNKAIENAMFIAQHIDNLDEFESVKENWKYIAMVINRIFLIIFLFAGLIGSAGIYTLAPWSYYLSQEPVNLTLARLADFNLTGVDLGQKSCQEF